MTQAPWFYKPFFKSCAVSAIFGFAAYYNLPLHPVTFGTWYASAALLDLSKIWKRIFSEQTLIVFRRLMKMAKMTIQMMRKLLRLKLNMLKPRQSSRAYLKRIATWRHSCQVQGFPKKDSRIWKLKNIPDILSEQGNIMQNIDWAML